MPRQRAHTAGGIPPSPRPLTDGLSARGQTPPCSSGSALGKSLAQQRRLDRSPLGVHPRGPVRRRPPDDVRRNTAENPAQCTLISPIPGAFVSAQRNWITAWLSCRFPFAVRKLRFFTCRPSSTTRVRLTISRHVTHSANCEQRPPTANH